MKKFLLFIAFLITPAIVSAQSENGTSLAPVFQREVDMRLDIPMSERLRYARLLEHALAESGTPIESSQYVVMVDRNPKVQAIFVYWVEGHRPADRAHFIGASPTSTGKPGQFDYFITPLGVFPHTLHNMDYRAAGTRNGYGLRALGRKGMRVYDFGWTQGERGWGHGGLGQMRLLVHSTDPDRLEQRLGIPMSKGCIRIPASLNQFIDKFGLLDADYEQALAGGRKFWLLRPDRKPTPWSGRFLVIIDSGSTERPGWSPAPAIADELPGSAIQPQMNPH